MKTHLWWKLFVESKAFLIQRMQKARSRPKPLYDIFVTLTLVILDFTPIFNFNYLLSFLNFNYLLSFLSAG